MAKIILAGHGELGAIQMQIAPMRYHIYTAPADGPLVREITLDDAMPSTVKKELERLRGEGLTARVMLGVTGEEADEALDNPLLRSTLVLLNSGDV